MLEIVDVFASEAGAVESLVADIHFERDEAQGFAKEAGSVVATMSARAAPAWGTLGGGTVDIECVDLRTDWAWEAVSMVGLVVYCPRSL